MIPTIERVKFADILREAIEWSRLSISQFCLQSEFPPYRVYRAQHDDTIKLSLDSLEQILNRFP